MLLTRRPLAFPLSDLCFLLKFRQGVEPVGGQTEGLRYPEVSLVLGEKRSSFGSDPGARLIQ